MKVKVALVANLLPFLLQAAEVRLERVPESGLQPDAVADATGRVHLVYLTGDPKAADIHYVSRTSPTDPWSKPLRVNSQPGSAVAIGTVRGPRLTLIRPNRVGIIWNGSSLAEPKPAESAPLLFTRLNATGTEFEAQRNLMGPLRHLDGGAAVTSNGRGSVVVVWHAAPPAARPNPVDEASRGVYLAASEDDGKTFMEPRRIDLNAWGVCACCGLEAGFREDQTIVVLYRSATGGSVELKSSDGGRTFSSRRLDQWTLNQCPMTTTRVSREVDYAVWSTRGAIQFARLDGTSALNSVTVSGQARKANHPVVVSGSDQRLLIAWTEGTAWQRGGELVWQMVNRSGEPIGLAGRTAGIPVWDYPAAVREVDGHFALFY